MYIDSLMRLKPVDGFSSKNKQIKLEFKKSSTTISCDNVEEVMTILGSHLKRFNKRKVNQIKRLTELSEEKDTPYDSFCFYHEMLIRKLWSLVFDGEPLEQRSSMEWKKFGFQNKDPASDFRGMGILGLLNLIYLAETRPTLIKSILTGREYPFAAAGINITGMLCNLLNMLDADASTRHVLDSKWDSPLLNFFCYTGYEKCFEELYCISCELLDHIYLELQSTYMEFPKIIGIVEQQIKKIVALKPTSFEEFYDLNNLISLQKNLILS